MRFDHTVKLTDQPCLTFCFAAAEEQRTVCMWEGYFDAAMVRVPPDPQGWTGWARLYHLDEGWYDADAWRTTDLQTPLRQLGCLELQPLQPDYRAAMKDLLQCLRWGVRVGATLTVTRD